MATAETEKNVLETLPIDISASNLEIDLPSNVSTSNLEAIQTFMASDVFWVSLMLFIISVLVFMLISKSIRDPGCLASPHELLKIFGIPFIVVSAVFVVMVIDEKDKITPIIGLMGTVAGYLLGKSDSKEETGVTAPANGRPPDDVAAGADPKQNGPVA